MIYDKLAPLARSLTRAKIGTTTTVNISNHEVNLEICRFKGIKCLQVQNAGHPELSFYVNLTNGRTLDDHFVYHGQKRPAPYDARRIKSFQTMMANSDFPRDEILHDLKPKKVIRGTIQTAAISVDTRGEAYRRKTLETFAKYDISKTRTSHRSPTLDGFAKYRIDIDNSSGRNPVRRARRIMPVTPPRSRSSSPPDKNYIVHPSSDLGPKGDAEKLNRYLDRFMT